jgi:hypothetical protein
MSFLKTIAEAVRSWRRGRTGPKNRKRPRLALEQLDHRQLLSVNFTGNVITDFPAAQTPGVVVLPDNPGVAHPQIPPTLKDIVKVSGLDINGIRLSYTASDDTLSIGLQGPDNQKSGQPVIAGDTDNNLNSATVSPAVLAIEPDFKNFPDMGGSQTMGAFLDLKNTGTPDIVAGISNDVGVPKTYQVALAVVNPAMPNSIPGFGTLLPQNAGNIYLVNDPAHPNMEFSISHFSQLYLAETGKPLTSASTIRVGGFGNSDDDDGISEAFFPSQPVSIGAATIPPMVCPVCPPPTPPPPANPPIQINPHLHRHVNTAHPTDIRVNVLGSARFDVTKIEPQTVRLGGAGPIFSFTRHINRDPYLDATFVFRGTDVTLPPGRTNAEVTGTLTDGTKFDSIYPIFNRDKSFYSPRAVAAQSRHQERMGARAQLTPGEKVLAHGNLVDLAIQQEHDSGAPLDGPIVTIPRRANGVTVNFYEPASLPPDIVAAAAPAPTAQSSPPKPVVTIPTRSKRPEIKPAQLRVGPRARPAAFASLKAGL